MTTRSFSKTTLALSLTAMLAGGAFAAAPSTTPPDKKAPAQSASSTEDKFFQEFRRIEDRLDKLFDKTWNTTWDKAPSDLNGAGAPVDFTSAVNVSTEGNNYVVHLAMPDRDLGKVDAKIEPNNVLHITAKEETENGKAVQPGTTSSGKEDALKSFSKMRYEQLLTLPGAVDSAKMKIDRQGANVTITLPKLEATTPAAPQQ
jgi:HSP20 family molecular chaperone IbpA